MVSRHDLEAPWTTVGPPSGSVRDALPLIGCLNGSSATMDHSRVRTMYSVVWYSVELLGVPLASVEKSSSRRRRGSGRIYVTRVNRRSST